MRLERKFRLESLSILNNFNSIKVRLELAIWLSLYSFPSYFNSIKVRLELWVLKQTQRVDIKFQFHKGAIRTIYTYLINPYNCHFNSIKVRLERRWTGTGRNRRG